MYGAFVSCVPVWMCNVYTFLLVLSTQVVCVMEHAQAPSRELLQFKGEGKGEAGGAGAGGAGFTVTE